MLPKGTLPRLESEFTHTLFYLAQLYKHLGNAQQSAAYCHQTLQRQLKYDIDTLNRKEWVVNAQNLAVFYINEGRFRQGIHCLEAAGKMCESVLSPDDDDEKESDPKVSEVEGGRFHDVEEEKRMKADIENSWGVLYSEILKKSYVIMAAAEDTDADSGGGSGDATGGDEEKEAALNPLMKTQSLIALDEKLKIDNAAVLFESLDLDEPPMMELASTYKEAKELFVPGLSHFMNAIAFYVLDGFVTDHTKIAQNISTIYKYLAFFEGDLSTKCKLHKRRVNLLKDIEGQLAVNAYEHLVQDLCYELGSTYENMATLKRDIFHRQQDETKQSGNGIKPVGAAQAKQIKKINDLLS